MTDQSHMAGAWSPFGAWARRMPVQGRAARLNIAPGPNVWLLQADPEDEACLDAVEAGFGLRPASTIGAVVAAHDASGEPDARRVVSIGPDAWLLLGAGGGLDEAVTQFGHASLVDVSDARVWLRIDGAAADALAKLTTLDLDLAAFPVGCAYGAKLGPLHVLLERTAADGFLISGQASTAEHLAEMLTYAVA